MDRKAYKTDWGIYLIYFLLLINAVIGLFSIDILDQDRILWNLAGTTVTIGSITFLLICWPLIRGRKIRASKWLKAISIFCAHILWILIPVIRSFSLFDLTTGVLWSHIEWIHSGTSLILLVLYLWFLWWYKGAKKKIRRFEKYERILK